MEVFFIVILAVLLFAVWRSSRNAGEQLRNDLEGLRLEVGSLRSQLAALVKAQAGSPPIAAPSSASESPAKQTVVAPPPAAQQPIRPTPPPPTAAQIAAPPAVAAFRPPVQAPVAPPQAPVAARPAPTSPVPVFPSTAQPKPPSRVDQPIAATEDAVPARAFSLEETLGANWLNKLGIAILVIGLAFFLAFKLQTWGPGGKVLCGYCVSLALLAGGVWLERKPTYRIFARGGIGGGWALAFFTTYAMYHVSAAHVLTSLVLDLVLMMLVAAGMVAHSLRYNSQTITGLAFLLGFVTLLTSHLEAAGGTVVFSLTASAVLAIGLVVVTTLRHWVWLELTGLITVYLTHFVWLARVLPENHAEFAEFWPSTLLILLYWLIFRIAYVLRVPRDQKEENVSSLSAVFNSIGVLGLLKYEAAHPEWAFWALMAMGAIEMGLAFRVRSRRRQAFVVLSTIATVLLVSAVPFRFHGVSWPVLWLVQAQILAVCGLRLGEPVFRRLGLLAGVITGGVLAFHDVLPLLVFRLENPDPTRHTSLWVALALAALLYWIHAEVYPRRWPQIAEDDREAAALVITSWLGVAAAATALWVALPDLWVPVGWLALVLVLGFAAHRFKGTWLAVEADMLALGAGAILCFHHIAPMLLSRLDNPDPGHHPAETAVLALAALAYWIRADIYPRVLPRLDSDSFSGADLSGWQATMLPVLSWLGAIAGAAALWVVLPDLWIPVGWLALVLLLAFAAHRFGTARLAIEADALALLSAAVLAFHHVAPLAWFRLENPDPSHHPAETTVLALAAAAYWILSELYPRVLTRLIAAAVPDSNLHTWQSIALPATSWLGAAAAAAALWVALPASWAVVGWLALLVLLGICADWINAKTLALQADLLAVCAATGLIFWDAWNEGWWDHRTPLIAAVALFYVGMRRRTVPSGAGNYVAPAYSWVASVLLAFVAADISSASALTLVWVLLGLALFEIGRLSKKGFLRWQGYLFIATSIGRYLFGIAGIVNSEPRAADANHFNLIYSLLLEVLVVAAAGYWLLERTRNRERCTRTEYVVGIIADALGTLSIALWFAYRFPSEFVPVPGGGEWVTAIWAGMATALLALAWLMKRRVFQWQAMLLVAAAFVRAMVLDLPADSPPVFWNGPLFHLGLTAVILLAALPFAFRLRDADIFPASEFSFPTDIGWVLRRPEQWFFFAAFAMEVIVLAVKLSSGHITIAWSLLGLAVFLFALIVGERSFRLAGLGLLLVSVAKILLMDVWKLSPSDRYTTLIVLGLALLAVSFLYTRFAATIRKFL
jgi:uncharacterized membrane protein